MGIASTLKKLISGVKRVVGPLEALQDEVTAKLKKIKLPDGRPLGQAIADEIRALEKDDTLSGEEKMKKVVERWAPWVADIVVTKLAKQLNLPEDSGKAVLHITRQLVQSVFVGVRGQSADSTVGFLVKLLAKQLGV